MKKEELDVRLSDDEPLISSNLGLVVMILVILYALASIYLDTVGTKYLSGIMYNLGIAEYKNQAMYLLGTVAIGTNVFAFITSVHLGLTLIGLYGACRGITRRWGALMTAWVFLILIPFSFFLAPINLLISILSFFTAKNLRKLNWSFLDDEDEEEEELE